MFRCLQRAARRRPRYYRELLTLQGHRTMTRYSLQVLREGVNCQLEACLQIAVIRESVVVSGIEGGSGRGLVERGLRVKGVFV